MPLKKNINKGLLKILEIWLKMPLGINKCEDTGINKDIKNKFCFILMKLEYL